MLNKNFYPTPNNIIYKMLSGLKLYDLRILEPSAGKGDILDYITNCTSEYRNVQMFCIEKESDLQLILRGKKYKLIDDDFLSFVPDCIFDLIIMNPPFDNGVKHFLKAWEIGSNTEIRCLLPEEVINNPYTSERKLVKQIIDDNNGKVEYLGDCFKHAERTTNVNIVLISIFKKDKTEFTFEFTKHFDQEKKYKLDDINHNDIAVNDVFDNMEIRYNKGRECLKKLIEIKNELLYYVGDMIDVPNIIDIFSNNKNNDKDLFNDLCDNARKSAWNHVFNNTKMNNVVTTNTKKKIDKVQEQQGHMAFTAKNIENLYSDLFQNIGNIMHDCVVESFDLLTKYHKENRCHVEGWKTNEQFYVNRKFILPYCIDPSFYSYSKIIHMNYQKSLDICDIEKALCHITGKRYDDIKTIYNMFSKKEIVTYGKWYDSEFLEFKCFKKGTMHFKFKSETMWNKFNIMACKGKNWIGNK